jgi:hypothetical protein
METNHDVFLSKYFWDILKDFDFLQGNFEILEERKKIIDLLRNNKNKLIVDISNFKSLVNSYKSVDTGKNSFEVEIAFRVYKSRLNLPIIKNDLINAMMNSNKPGVALLEKKVVVKNNLSTDTNNYVYTENNYEECTFSKNDIQDVEVSPDMYELSKIILQTRNLYIIDKYIFTDSMNREKKMPNIFKFLQTFINQGLPGIRINILASRREAEKDANFDQKLTALKNFASHNLARITIVLFNRTHNLPLTYEKSERFILTDYLFIKNSHPFDRNNIAHVAFMPNKPETQSIANRILNNFIILSDMATQNGKMTNFYYSPDRNIQKFVFNGFTLKSDC